MEIVCIKRQKLPKRKLRDNEYNFYSIVDKDSIILEYLPIKFMKSCIVLIVIDNIFYYSETFNKFYKTLILKERKGLISHTSVSIENEELKIVITDNDIYTYEISDFGIVKINKNE